MTLFQPRQNRIVLNYGVYDAFDQMQVRALRAMALLGNGLIIGCATDACCETSGRYPRRSYEKRRTLLENCRFVDRVIAVHSFGQTRTDIVNYNASVFVMGREWTGTFDDLQDISQVVYLAQAIEDQDIGIASRSGLKVAV